MSLQIGGLAKISTVDFPGVLACVVFLRGCDLNCFYCHNRRLIEGADHSGDLTEAQLWDFLEKRRGLLDGVVFSGGEPTLYPELPEALARARALGYRVKLDTNGQNPDRVAEILRRGLIDYAAVDVKGSAEDYAALFGGGADALDRVLQTLELLRASGMDFEARTTLFPGLDGPALLALAERMPRVPHWRLNFFRRPDPPRAGFEEALEARVLSQNEITLLERGLYAAQPGLIRETE